MYCLQDKEQTKELRISGELTFSYDNLEYIDKLIAGILPDNVDEKNN